VHAETASDDGIDHLSNSVVIQSTDDCHCGGHIGRPGRRLGRVSWEVRSSWRPASRHYQERERRAIRELKIHYFLQFQS